MHQQINLKALLLMAVAVPCSCPTQSCAGSWRTASKPSCAADWYVKAHPTMTKMWKIVWLWIWQSKRTKENKKKNLESCSQSDQAQQTSMELPYILWFSAPGSFFFQHQLLTGSYLFNVNVSFPTKRSSDQTSAKVSILGQRTRSMVYASYELPVK